MPRKKYLMLEHAIQRLFEDDKDEEEQSDKDIVFPPETAKASKEAEGKDNILNHDNDDLFCDTASEIIVHSKKKFESSESSCSPAKKFKNPKLNNSNG
ncbi:hypothetical protein AVEN_185364-1 [Araneus ventricosus]|uniref:Uncharacterized protein n=1 Tax=Araneus ventricosus TaxID=182803 RepID=A0A4Y2PWT9_ARAVE|nr:hypothetical protein AVEN_185364-1 [Araneus ventricosus]